MFKNQLFQVSHFQWWNTLVPCQPDRIKPEFALTIRCFDMYMGRLKVFIRIKMEPV